MSLRRTFPFSHSNVSLVTHVLSWSLWTDTACRLLWGETKETTRPPPPLQCPSEMTAAVVGCLVGGRWSH